MSVALFITIVVSGFIGALVGALIARAGPNPWVPWAAWWAAWSVAMCSYVLLQGFFK